MGIIPRFSTLVLLAIRGRLNTRDRLVRFGLHEEERCVLCTKANESHNHLFFEYEFSSKIWNSLLCKSELD